MSKVLVFLADGFETIEGLTVVDVLRRGGVEVETVSITDSNQVTTSHRIPLMADTTIGQVDFASADMLVLPGGLPGTTNLEACEALMEQVDVFAKAADKYVAAICAAPSILGHRGILQGKCACCYPGYEDQLTGAEVDQTKEAILSGNIITGKSMGCALSFALTILEALEGSDAMTKIKKAVVYEH